LTESATDLVQQYNKDYQDARSRKPSIYKEGEYILVRNTRSKLGESAKIKANYKGPYIISKVLGNNLYVIRDIPGF